MEVALKNRTILQGDILEKLREIPDESIDCVITSPPYWGLRDYGADGQWGLEPSFEYYLLNLQRMMDELRRVVTKTGTVWINLGDSYGSHRSNEDDKMVADKQEQNALIGFDKSRLGIPERFYVQCIDDGWIARNHIPWIKENAMPSSVKDRFTNKWESIFFFAKEQKYYFNLDAVRVKAYSTKDQKPFNLRVREAKIGGGQAKLGDDPRAWKMSEKEDKEYDKRGFRKQDSTLGADGKPLANYKGFNARWKKYKENIYGDDDKDSRRSRTFAHLHTRKWDKSTQTIKNHFGNFDPDGKNLNHPNGKNPGDIFKINPRPFPKAHFATFPIDLPLKILKCACPPNGFVLDPFFGAGTVGLAAEKLGMNWIGIELKKEYIELAEKRLYPYRNNKII